jgi:hypothetical protein
MFYWIVLYPQWITEIRRSLFQYDKLSHIYWAINYSYTFPARLCTDTNTTKTWTEGALSIDSVGCENLILGGGNLCNFFIINLLPPLYGMRPQSALLATTINLVALLAATFSVGGSSAWLVCSAVVIHLSSGLAGAYLCHFHRSKAKAQYAVTRSIRLLSDQNRSLLHTFIPAGVAAHLAAHLPGEMLEAAMDHVIVMFCSLEPRAALRAADADTFALLHRVFSDFDVAVAAAGMFKYQVRVAWMGFSIRA